MKTKNALKLGCTLLLALALGACQQGEKSSAPASSGKSASSQQSAPASSQQSTPSSTPSGDSSQQPGGDTSQQPGGDEKGVTISSLVFEKKNDNKVYIKASGTQSGYTATDFLWAWGILTGGNQQGQGQGSELTDDSFIYGKAAPAAADCTVVAFNANKEFTAELCLTDVIAGVQDFSPALYTIYGGTPDTYAAITPTDASSKAQDTDYKYYVRDDQFCIAIDKIPDVAFETAVLYKPSASELPSGKTAGIYVKIGGDVKSGVNIADLEMSADFQRVLLDGSEQGAYQKHNIDNETEFFWTTEGNKAYVNLYVGFMAAGEAWMTHLGFNVPETTTWWGGTEKNIPNCYMANDILDVVYNFASDGLKMTVHAQESAGQSGGAAAYYGCLGFAVEELLVA